jgi:CBS domain-containing protein
MSLERFRRTRMVVVTRRSMAYQAARAMADNHIGSVLVSEPGGLAGIITDRDLALDAVERMLPLLRVFLVPRQRHDLGLVIRQLRVIERDDAGGVVVVNPVARCAELLMMDRRQRPCARVPIAGVPRGRPRHSEDNVSDLKAFRSL